MTAASHAGLERARLLMDRRRHDQAADELRRALGQDPENALLHAYLALCLLEDPARRAEALQAALGATAKDPEQPLGWYAVAQVEWKAGRHGAAEEAARVALGLSPRSPSLFSTLGGILLDRGRTGEALEAVEGGLAVDPEDVPCLNLRSQALSRLGRHGEAVLTMERALAHDPENAFTHNALGWVLLRGRGDAPRAVGHFREALRLDPSHGRAREGLLEALRARNPVYRALLRAALRRPGVDPSTKWVAIAVGVMVVLWIPFLLGDGPLGRAVAVPLQAAVIAAVVLPWTARSLTDLLLLFDPLGRLVLSRAQRVAAVATGATLALGGACTLAALVAGGVLPVFGGMALLLYTIPIAATVRTPAGRGRALMTAYTVLLLVPIGVFLVLQARAAGDPAMWFGVAVAGIAMSDLVADRLARRV